MSEAIKNIFILAFLIILIVAGITTFNFFNKTSQEAKQGDSPATSTFAAFIEDIAGSETEQPTTTQNASQQNWQTYNNTQYGFVLKYPKDIAIIRQGSGALSYDWESLSTFLGVKIVQIYVQNGWFNIGQSNDPQGLANCLNPYSTSQTTATINREINGIVYSCSNGVDSAAGKRYEFIGCRVIRDGKCFALNSVIVSAGSNFDKNKISLLLDEILQSFVWVK